MTPALAQARLLALIPCPHVRPRGRLQFVQGPGNQAATLQLPASRGQGRTWVTWGHAWTNERALIRDKTNRRRELPDQHHPLSPLYLHQQSAALTASCLEH